MGMGVELWLAMPYTAWAGAAPKEAPRLPDPLPLDADTLANQHEPGNVYWEWHQRFREWAVPLNPALRQAWLAAVKGVGLSMGEKAGRKKTRGREGGLRYDLVEGVDARPFEFDTVSLGNEAGFAPDTRPMGVNLSGYYYPVFLDLVPGEQVGGLPNPVVLSGDLMSKVSVAQMYIERALPWMAAAKLQIVHLHY